ncbi:hypothetical protein [Xenorhabdus stockiae]|uniref:hypothetical protein n=1 Tax=Xenorhabdus stockiae TaxID=351614 RepID=UPI004063E5B4
MRKENIYNNDDFDLNVLNWNVDKWILETPKDNNDPENGGDYFIRYLSVLSDTKGNALEGVTIQLSSIIRNQILDKVIITTDPDDGKKPVVIKPINNDQEPFFNVSSGPEGKISFRVYPKKNTPAIFQLESRLPNSDSYYPISIVYITTPKSEGMDDSFQAPIITTLTGNELTSSGSEQTFEVDIPRYTGHSQSDTIIFFTDKNGSISPATKIRDARYDGANYSFSLYFDSFLPFNTRTNLYYVIINQSGIGRYSSNLEVIYSGGGDNRPSPDFSRSLASPIIYDSYAVPPFGSNDDVSIINSGDIVNINSIYNHSNNGGTALFVKIVGTNDVSNSSKPQFGDEVVLVIYVNSFSKTIHAKFPAEMVSFTPDNDNKRESTTIIKIPYEMLVDIEPYPESKEPPLIYFEYYVDTQGIRTYSQYWEAKISTVAP